MYINYKSTREENLAGAWLRECPVLYGAEISSRHFRIGISVMHLQKELPYTLEREDIFSSAYFRHTRFPSRQDYISLFRFYQRETLSKLRVFPFIVKAGTFILMRFDCLPGHSPHHRKIPPVHVILRLPALCELPGKYYLDSESSIALLLPHILAFLFRVTGCSRIVFLLGKDHAAYLTAFKTPGYTPVITPPGAGKPYWLVSYERGDHLPM